MKSLHEYLEYLTTIPYFERRIDIKNRIPTLSKFVYKYRSLDPKNDISKDRMRDLLVRSRLWLSSPDEFNDPFDLSANIVAKGTAKDLRKRYLGVMKANGMKHKERLRQIKIYMNEPKEALLTRLQTVYNDQAQKVGVFSFAGDLYWSSHTGHFF